MRSKIRGEVRFDAGSRALYATDGSNYRQAPIGVVVPQNHEDVVQTIATAHRFGAPILSRGCGTSLAGQCCNVAVVMDFSKYMHHVLHIDADKKLGTVQPGCVLDDLRHAAEGHGLTFGPDPSTHNHCTLGGMLGNDSCGAHSLLCAKHGRGLRTADNTHELEIVTYDGLRLRVGETSPEQLEAIIQAGGPRGEVCMPSSKRSATSMPTKSAGAFHNCRAACRATISTPCCRKTAFTSRVRWSARKGPWSPFSKPRSTWSHARRRAHWSSWDIPTSSKPAIT